MKILLVDDNEELRDTAGELLELAGHSVVPADRGDYALEQFDAMPDIDCLVTDYEMPGLDGLDLVEAVRTRRPAIPCVLITSHSRATELARRHRVALVAKPFSRERLLAAIEDPEAFVPEPPTAPPPRPSTPPPTLETRRKASSPPKHGPPRRGSMLRSLLAAAAVAAAALVILPRFADLTAPALPEAPTTGTVRSNQVEILSPDGPLASPPGTLRWRAVPQAASYDVAIEGVDGRVLWRHEAVDTEIMLPDEISQSLHPMVVYYWKVEARDAAGVPMAVSTRTRFRIIETTDPSQDRESSPQGGSS